MSVPTQHTQPPVPPAQPMPRNGLGTTSLVMGILSVVGSWIPSSASAHTSRRSSVS